MLSALSGPGYCFSEYNDCTGKFSTETDMTAVECCGSPNSLSYQDRDKCIPCDSICKLEWV